MQRERHWLHTADNVIERNQTRLTMCTEFPWHLLGTSSYNSLSWLGIIHSYKRPTSHTGATISFHLAVIYLNTHLPQIQTQSPG